MTATKHLFCIYLVGMLLAEFSDFAMAQSDHLLPANPVQFESDYVRNPMIAIAKVMDADSDTLYKAVVQITYIRESPSPEVSCLSLCAERGETDGDISGFTAHCLSLANVMELQKDPNASVQPLKVKVGIDKELGSRMWELWKSVIMTTRHVAPNSNEPIIEGAGVEFHSATYSDGKIRSGRVPTIDGECPVNFLREAHENLIRYVKSGGMQKESLSKFRNNIEKLEKIYRKEK